MVYPCKDGGEIVVTYVSRADKSSRLDIVKTGNPKDSGRGDWFRRFYSETAIKNYKDRFGNDATKTIKKKGARKQVLSCQNGRPTEEVHVPLKRWELIKEYFGFNNGKKVSDINRKKEIHKLNFFIQKCIDINPHNPRDFDRFID